jgi:hypothetical protein
MLAFVFRSTNSCRPQTLPVHWRNFCSLSHGLAWICGFQAWDKRVLHRKNPYSLRLKVDKARVIQSLSH